MAQNQSTAASTPPSGVGKTSLFVASGRALESSKPANERLFYDEFAAALAGSVVVSKEGIAQLPPDAQVAYEGIAVRTKFVDTLVYQYVVQNLIQQVIVPGAGLDDRAFRLALPKETKFFEIDFPSVLKYKNTVLEEAHAIPTCERAVIEADITSDGWISSLENLGYDKAKPSLWLLEGLLMYLDERDVHTLLNRIDQNTSPGSKVIAHLGTDPPQMSQYFWQIISDLKVSFKFFTNEPVALFESHGFSQCRVFNMTKEVQEVVRQNKRAEDVQVDNKPFADYFLLASKQPQGLAIEQRPCT